MKSYNQWIVVKYVPQSDGDTEKLPVDHRTLRMFPKGSGWQQDPAAWTSYEQARMLADLSGPDYGVGFLFTSADPFFFLDLDDCLTDNQPSSVAVEMVGRFPGAAVEVSHSGKGLHIFGSYVRPEPAHSCRFESMGMELYTSGRFAAITGDRWTGDAKTDCTMALGQLITDYFSSGGGDKAADIRWTAEARADYTGPADDDELIAKAMVCVSSSGAFLGKASFAQLWNNDVSALSNIWPTTDEVRDYDYSSADAALAQHLAFWTGNNCERILRIMQRSSLVRDKWERADYLTRTILRAVAGQAQVYSIKAVDPTGLKGSEKQIKWAAGIRAAMLSTWPDLADALGAITDAKYWIDNQGKTGPEMVQSITPVDKPAERPIDGPEYTCGYQLLGPEQQLGHFKGCVYVQSEHKIFTPSGAMLKSEQFNATYGGFRFTIGSGDNAKPTRKAWDAFTESELVRWPIAEATCFRPQEPPGAIIEHEGRLLVNTYIPAITRRVAGDIGPFLLHLSKVLPDPGDQEILLNYMAGCVQFKGLKFQWAPLIQGVQGNGKSLFSRCLVEAIGRKYCHMPRPHTISADFNAWQFGKLFIGIEDIYIPDQRRELAEILKPMITGEWQAIRKMQTDEGMAESCANFLFNSNHKDAVRKTESDRRYCVFYSAQQTKEDLIRDGMTGDYFPKLYEWLRADGYAIVHEYLATKKISHEFKNILVFRAPQTSTTHEAIVASLGMIEQKILDMVDEGLPGFAGGWISSAALENMLRNMNMHRSISINRRREILQGLGYDWHPALKKGRVNNLVLPDNSKPVLFIKKGHLAAQLVGAATVAARYTADQGAEVIGFESAARMG